jgi:diguanylate cyclase (GGDEF)-like protein
MSSSSRAWGSSLWSALVDSAALLVILRGGRPFLFSKGLRAMLGAGEPAAEKIGELFDVAARQPGRATFVEGELLDQAGRIRQVRFDLSWSGPHTEFVLAVGHDETEQRAREAEFERRALTDGLTGLPNRALFDDRFGQALLAAGRNESTVGLLLFDIDRFKDVNDTFGHRTGDELLRLVAERVRGELRVSDTVARMGGDEFAIVLPQASDASSAVRTADKIARRLAEPFTVTGSVFEVSASFGVALFPDDGTSADILLDRADEAMYAAKRRGTGVSLYDGNGGSRAHATAARVDQLRQAIRDDVLALEFQPTVRLRDRQTVRLEALVRWPQPTSHALEPAAFVAMAERNGLGRALSSWVLRRALGRYRDWQRMGIGDGLSVNVSLADLADRGFRERVLHELGAQHVEPSALTLEVSARALDGAMITRIERPVAELSETGVRFALDDFGTSVATLPQVLRLPFAELKVDGSFIAGLCTESASWRFVRQAIDGAHDRGLETTAEGVEDETTARVLERLGCDVAQGRHLTHALVGERVTFLRTGGQELARSN